MTDSDPAPSLSPPAVKVVKAAGTIVENCVVLCFIGAGFLLGKLSPVEAGAAAAVVLGLVSINQLFRGPGSHVGVLSFLPKSAIALLEAMRHHGG